MSTYQIIVVITTLLIDIAAVAFTTFVCWSMVQFPELRADAKEAVQNGDKVTHWTDGKNVVFLILGLFAGAATFNLLMIFVLFQMFDAGPIGVVGFMTTVTGAFLGISLHKKQ
jgi:hypothetical protein